MDPSFFIFGSVALVAAFFIWQYRIRSRIMDNFEKRHDLNLKYKDKWKGIALDPGKELLVLRGSNGLLKLGHEDVRGVSCSWVTEFKSLSKSENDFILRVKIKNVDTPFIDVKFGTKGEGEQWYERIGAIFC